MTDFMAPGDFDGDGIGDIAVWRETNGNWYRMNSATNTFTSSPGASPATNLSAATMTATARPIWPSSAAQMA